MFGFGVFKKSYVKHLEEQNSLLKHDLDFNKNMVAEFEKAETEWNKEKAIDKLTKWFKDEVKPYGFKTTCPKCGGSQFEVKCERSVEVYRDHSKTLWTYSNTVHGPMYLTHSCKCGGWWYFTHTADNKGEKVEIK